MTALIVEPLTPASRARFALTDAVTATRRYLLRSLRQPDIVIGGLLMPIVFVLLFGYVFGSSIHVPGGNYRAYLMSGLFAQSTLFASAVGGRRRGHRHVRGGDRPVQDAADHPVLGADRPDRLDADRRPPVDWP